MRQLLRCIAALEWGAGEQPLGRATGTPRVTATHYTPTGGTGPCTAATGQSGARLPDLSSHRDSAQGGTGSIPAGALGSTGGTGSIPAGALGSTGVAVRGGWVDLRQLLLTCQQEVAAAGAGGSWPAAASDCPAGEAPPHPGHTTSQRPASSAGERIGSTSSEWASHPRHAGSDRGCQADGHSTEVAAMQQWLQQFLQQHGPQQLPLAHVQLAADALRTAAFQQAFPHREDQ